MIELKHFIDRGVGWIHLLLLFRVNSGLLKEFEIICEGSWTGRSNISITSNTSSDVVQGGITVVKKSVLSNTDEGLYFISSCLSRTGRSNKALHQILHQHLMTSYI